MSKAKARKPSSKSGAKSRISAASITDQQNGKVPASARETNTVKTVEGKINQRTVWVRVEAVDPKVTAVTVQTRTSGGVSDLDLAHEVEKQIALKLVR